MKKAFTMIELIFIIVIAGILGASFFKDKEVSDVNEKDVRAIVKQVVTTNKSTSSDEYKVLKQKYTALQKHAVKSDNELIACRSELSQTTTLTLDAEMGTGY